MYSLDLMGKSLPLKKTIVSPNFKSIISWQQDISALTMLIPPQSISVHFVAKWTLGRFCIIEKFSFDFLSIWI